MTSPLVWILVLHWKELELTRACLKSLQLLDYDHYHVLVIDNDSDDGSLDELRAEFSDVHILGLAANTGFAGGCNVGIRCALNEGAAYVLLLNNDAQIAPDTLKQLVESSEADPQLGILTPKIVYADQPERLYGHGGRRLPFRIRLVSMNALDRGPWSGPPVLLDFVFGCVMLIKRQVIEQIGLLDERFFMYFEDIDYCYRATDNGFTVGYLPGVVVPHVGSGSTRRRNGFREFLLGRSRQQFFRKHLAGLWWAVYVPYELFYTVRFVLRLIWQRHFRAALLYTGGTLAGMVTAPRSNSLIKTMIFHQEDGILQAEVKHRHAS